MMAYFISALFYIFEWQMMEKFPSAIKTGKYIIIIFQSILPITYVINVHRSAYSKMAYQEQAKMIEEARISKHPAAHMTVCKLSQFDLRTNSTRSGVEPDQNDFAFADENKSSPDPEEFQMKLND